MEHAGEALSVRIKEWIRRNYGKILLGSFTGVAFTGLSLYGVYRAGGYFFRMAGRQQLEHSRQREFYLATERSLRSTLTSELASISLHLQERIEVPSGESLRHSTGQAVTREEKLSLWQAAEDQAFLHFFVSLYAASASALLLQTQVSIAAHYLYADALAEERDAERARWRRWLFSSPKFGVPPAARKRFLQQSTFVYEGGLKALVAHVSVALAAVLPEYGVGRSVDFAELGELVRRVRAHVERADPLIAGSSALLRLFLPPEEGFQGDGETVLLMNELRDCVEGAAFAAAAREALDAVFRAALTLLRPRFVKEGGEPKAEAIARLLPKLTSVAREMLEQAEMPEAQADNEDDVPIRTENGEIDIQELFRGEEPPPASLPRAAAAVLSSDHLQRLSLSIFAFEQ